MADEVQLARLEQGVEVWNEWKRRNPRVYVDLRKADLYKAELSCADLNRTDLGGANLCEARLYEAKLDAANLSGADLTGASLSDARFHSADLTGASLSDAQLYSTDFWGARLSGADLREAKLIMTNFSRANLDGADFGEAIMAATLFAGNDLSTVKGLENVLHFGPSFVSIDTLYKSKGNIPELFLRGAGVPQDFIIFMHSLSGKAFQFDSCFISHSSIDKAFCERLLSNLQANGVTTWYFPKDAKWGEPLWEEIDRSIKNYDKLIVVCSKNSLNSRSVLGEIERALYREEKESKNILFPVTLDDYIFEEWEHPRKVDLLNRVIGDFRGWNNDTVRYDAAFGKLLRALSAASK